jgi:hypothetical protein
MATGDSGVGRNIRKLAGSNLAAVDKMGGGGVLPCFAFENRIAVSVTLH